MIENTRKLKNMRSTTCRPTQSGGFEMVYHWTAVFTSESRREGPGTVVTLRTGGHRSVTTKARMNWCFVEAGIPAVVYQKNWDWFLSWNTHPSFEGEWKKVPFDSETLKALFVWSAAEGWKCEVANV